MTATARNYVYTRTPETEIERFTALGVAVVPVPYGEKGARLRGWPGLPAYECWRRSRAAATRGPLNLAVRLGPTVDESRILAHLDLDGRDDVAGDAALEIVRSMSVFDGAAIVATSPGRYRLLFWATAEMADAVIPELGAEVAAYSGRLSNVYGKHPAGHMYRYIVEPTEAMPTINIEELGFDIERKKSSPTATDRLKLSATAASAPALPPLRELFVGIFLKLGIAPNRGLRHDSRGEWYRCCFHNERAASLHVDWPNCTFFCFGCGDGGGYRSLRELAEVAL